MKNCHLRRLFYFFKTFICKEQRFFFWRYTPKFAWASWRYEFVSEIVAGDSQIGAGPLRERQWPLWQWPRPLKVGPGPINKRPGLLRDGPEPLQGRLGLYQRQIKISQWRSLGPSESARPLGERPWPLQRWHKPLGERETGTIEKFQGNSYSGQDHSERGHCHSDRGHLP